MFRGSREELASALLNPANSSDIPQLRMENLHLSSEGEQDRSKEQWNPDVCGGNPQKMITKISQGNSVGITDSIYGVSGAFDKQTLFHVAAWLASDDSS